MPRILLVKTSSLGDVVHNLPVASDIAFALPGAEIDWVVEEAFAPIPAMHAGVSHVMPAAVRRWRKNLWRSETRTEVRAFVSALRERDYDAVIDTQGLFKSALITRAARGKRYGMDWRSSREPLAMFYDRTFSAPRTRHAVERNRSIAAQALRLNANERADYNIVPAKKAFPWLPARDYAVFVHATSAQSKLWRSDQWIELAKEMTRRKAAVVLPWGAETERERSQDFARRMPNAVVPPRLDIADVASVLAAARCVIGVDTGLTHLAAAIGTPTVGIYMATHIEQHGLYHCARARNVGGYDVPSSARDVERALAELDV